MNPVLATAVLPAAFLLDLILGDPHRLPHPVRWMGRLIETGEPFFRRAFSSEVAAGGFFVFTLILITWIVTIMVVESAAWIHPFLGYLVEIVLIFFTVSVKSLRTEAMGVQNALIGDELEAARQRVAMIVGRDVDKLSRRGIARATVETVAENLVDGFVSPIFYAAIGGAPLAMTYRMINTLDAMVGYKNKRFYKFGKISARLDDAANYIPARLAVAFISAASELLFRTGIHALFTAKREGRQHSSPNAGYPEAAFAGGLGVKLGGSNFYHDRLVYKPYIGVHYGEVEPKHIPAACRLMQLSAMLWLVGVCIIRFVFETVW